MTRGLSADVHNIHPLSDHFFHMLQCPVSVIPFPAVGKRIRGHIQDPHYISMSFGLKLSVANLHLFSPSCLYYFLSGYVPLPGTALRISRFSLLHSVPDRQVLLAVFPVAILLRIAGEAGTACLVRPVKNAV